VHGVQLRLTREFEGILEVEGRSDYLPPIRDPEIMDIEKQTEVALTTLKTGKQEFIEIVYSRQTSKFSHHR